MKNVFILGIALAVVLSAGTAMAAGDQNSETFQTLGSMQTIEMTDTELNAVEGKSSKYRGYKGYSGHKGGYTQYYYKSNTNSTFQLNDCFQCSADGGYGGGGNISQSNSNYTYQSN